MELSLYSAKGSNSSERVEWVLNYKGISYQRIEVENCELKKSYLNVNKFGYVPTLVFNGNIISESMAIIELIEECFPNYAILPDDLLARAKVREICEYVNSTIHSPQNRTALNFFKPSASEEEICALRGQWVSSCLHKMEPLLWQQSIFAISNEFSVADIFVATIYKKALQFGVPVIEAFSQHLVSLRLHDRISVSEPKA